MIIHIYINKANIKFISRVKNITSKVAQFFFRMFTGEKPYVYLRYRYTNTHPGFIRMYHTPPIKWSNRYNAKLFHWLGYADFVDERPFIVEPNDHPLSAHGWKGRPSYDVKNFSKIVSEARELYEKDNCKSVILTSQQNILFFKAYMPKKIWHKIKLLPSDVGAIPRKFDWSTRITSKKVKFLCIASDYDLKGISIMLRAWSFMKVGENASLTIVCPKFPSLEGGKECTRKGVEFIEQGPITEEFKKNLYISHHVALCPTLVDGGTNIIEAMEYGLPILTNKYHRSESYIIGNNGFIVSSPYQYYDVEHYGLTWSSVSEYMDVVNTSIEAGGYDFVVQEWKEYMEMYIADPCLSYCQGIESYNLSSNELSQSFRNKSLRVIYKEALD